MVYPKISIVTVTLNSEQYLEECILSVVGQNYPNLEYIVVDGGSTDNTVQIIEKYQQHIAVFIREGDNGPANALNKGFAETSGEIMSWLNSDDKLHKGALFAVAEIFSSLNEVNWIMGYPTWYSQQGACVNEMNYVRDKFYRSPGFINDSMHMKFARWSKWRFAMNDFSAIQQESVFWKRGLWEKAGGYLKEGTLAHDLELWTRFFEHAQLFTCNVLLAGFRIHESQLSVVNADRYFSDSQEFINAFKAKLLVPKIKICLAKALRIFYYYNLPVFKNIYPLLLELPPYILYDFVKDKFVFSSKQ